MALQVHMVVRKQRSDIGQGLECMVEEMEETAIGHQLAQMQDAHVCFCISLHLLETRYDASNLYLLLHGSLLSH